MQQLWRHLCTIQFYGIMAFFTYLSLTSAPEKTVPVFNDTLMHIAGYLLASLSMVVAYPRCTWLRIAFPLFTYSVLIEILQHFNPPRTFDVMDIVANGVGVFAGLFLAFLLRRVVFIERVIHYGPFHHLPPH